MTNVADNQHVEKKLYKKEAGKRKAGNYYFLPKYSKKKKKPSKREVVFGLLPGQGVSPWAVDFPRWITRCWGLS